MLGAPSHQFNFLKGVPPSLPFSQFFSRPPKTPLRRSRLSLKCRRAASCPSRHGRVRRCPASSHRLTAEPQRRRHVIYRCSALLRLGWRRHRATCAIGAAANASGQEPALLRTGCHRDLYHRTTTLPRTRSASACQGRMPRPLCGHYLRLQLRLDTARGWWLASA